MRIKKLLFFIVIMLCWMGVAQTPPQVISHFPDSAFVTNRNIPFQVVGNEVQINRVDLLTGDRCAVYVDPFYSDTVQLICATASLVNFTVMATVDGQEEEIQVRFVTVHEERAPGEVIVPTYVAPTVGGP